MGWLRQLFYGRYGLDKLSVALLITAMAFSVAARLTGILWLGLPFYVGIIWAVYRMVSRDFDRRSRENSRFLELVGRAMAFFRLRWRMLQELGTHRYLKCPACGQRLRVPRGKGMINVTCARCRESFRKKV